MTTKNRIAVASEQVSKNGSPIDKKERERFWIARGNRILWGEEPTEKYGYLPPRRDLEWRCVDGNYFIAERGR